jgi:hypothetical protein
MKSPLLIYEELAKPPIFMVEYWTFRFQRRWWRHVYFPLSVGFWREQEEARGQLFYKIAEKKVVGCEVKRNKKEKKFTELDLEQLSMERRLLETQLSHM